MQRQNSIVRVRDQANDQARRPHSEAGAAKIVKIAVQRKESIQGSSDPASLVHLGGEKTREQHNEGVEKETKSRQRSSSWPNTESPERQHIDKVMCQLCCTGRLQQFKLSRKTVGFIKLQFIDKVVDSSVIMRRSV